MLSPKEAIQILVKESESEFLRKTEFATMSFLLRKAVGSPKIRSWVVVQRRTAQWWRTDNPYWVLDFPSDNFVTQMQLDDEWKQFILSTSEKWLTFDLT